MASSLPAEGPLPPLRPDLEIVPVEHEGKSVFVLRDPDAEDDQAVAVSPGGMAVASLLDDGRSAADVALLFKKETGADVSAADIVALARQLDDAGLLDTGASRAALKARRDAFLKSPARKAVFQGRGGYPAEPIALATFLGGFFRHAKGPGRSAPETPSKPHAAGLVSPHIDLHRGGPAYAHAYAALADSPPPDLIVALGVAHRSPDSPWAFTRKAYETPYGPMAVDPSLYEEMTKALWYDPLADEWTHRREHSLEFQALWLRYLWRDKTPPWVPILCSTFERFAEDKPPSSIPTVEEALQKLGAILAARAKKQRVLVLAGIDLAHVGPRFGDELELTPDLEKKIAAEDSVSLDHAVALDADAFYLSVVKDGHWRKVCGLSALYTSLRWIKAVAPAAKGERLTYGQAPDPAGGIVTFASAVYR
jgi:MEMO1 family protein